VERLSGIDIPDIEIESEQDHISIGGLQFLNFDYFNKKLQNIPGFEGFSPRHTLITRLRN
jgi:hypothetical protein